MQVINTLTTPTTPAQHTELEVLEEKLFLAREEVEVLWLAIGEYCAEIVDKKLYRYARDENGNYFRTAKAYFTDLDRRFRERGWHLSTTTLNRYIQDHRLVEKYDITPQQALTLGKSNLEAIAPAVRKLEKEGKGDAAIQLVREVVDAAVANEGLPLSEVQQAVSQVTGRVMKGLEVRFEKGMFGQKLSKLILWWDERPHDLLKMEITEEQQQWLQKRLGIKQGTHLT